MITLEDFKNNNLKINWKVIDIGCLGSEIFKNELSYDDIINFSLEEFDEKNKLILRIVASDRDEYQEMGYLVQELANMEKSEYKLAFEKWKLVYIKKNFPQLNKNIIQGLIELSDLWGELLPLVEVGASWEVCAFISHIYLPSSSGSPYPDIFYLI